MVDINPDHGMVSKNTAILIPARMKSSRLPGKPLIKLGNKFMIQRVYDECVKSGLDVYVLTDSENVAALFEENAVSISEKDYANGTERCADAIRHKMFDPYDSFINVQGDMPDISQDMIQTTLNKLKWIDDYSVTTMYTNMKRDLQNDPNSVKMILDSDNRALWFGRGMKYGEHHLGIYGYSRDSLTQYPQLKIPKEETIEGLEQLRWLKAGYNIGCIHTEFDGIEINTLNDAIEWRRKHGQVQNFETAQSSAAMHHYLRGDLPN